MRLLFSLVRADWDLPARIPKGLAPVVSQSRTLPLRAGTCRHSTVSCRNQSVVLLPSTSQIRSLANTLGDLNGLSSIRVSLSAASSLSFLFSKQSIFRASFYSVLVFLSSFCFLQELCSSIHTILLIIIPLLPVNILIY